MPRVIEAVRPVAHVRGDRCWLTSAGSLGAPRPKAASAGDTGAVLNADERVELEGRAERTPNSVWTTRSRSRANLGAIGAPGAAKRPPQLS